MRRPRYENSQLIRTVTFRVPNCDQPANITVREHLCVVSTASWILVSQVLATFDDPLFRKMLRDALPEGTSTLDPTVPATELLSRYRYRI